MSEWINTDDRKPEHGQAVLGADRTGYVTRFEYDATDPPCFLDDHEVSERVVYAHGRYDCKPN